jgi:predicted Zn-dependent protease
MTTLSSVLLRAALIVSLLGVMLTAITCSSLNVYPVSEDKNLGLQADKEIRQDPKNFPILNDPDARNYIQGIVNTLLTSSHIKYKKEFAYRVEIIKDDKTINAFCTPGGFIYVYTGLIKMLDNEASIAGVLGHEIAHAERRHSTARMTKELGVQTAMGIALGNNSNQNINLAANLFGGLGLMHFSREDELESDSDSFTYLKDTKKWYPGAIKYFFDKVKGKSGSSDIDRLLSTHPLPQDRIDQVNELLKKNNVPPPIESQLYTRIYSDFKSRLK